MPVKNLSLLLLVLLGLTSGCVPTISLHSFRDVQMSLTEANSGKPVTFMPFTVRYDAAAADSPLFYHLELRTPEDVCAQTDQNGQAVISLADYAWNTCLYVNDTNRHYFSEFVLTKQLIRSGGTVEQWYWVPPKSWGEGYPKTRATASTAQTAQPKSVQPTGSQPVSSETNRTSSGGWLRWLDLFVRGHPNMQ